MTNLHKGRAGIDRVWHATGHSIAGLRGAYRSESAFRQELWTAVILAPIAFWVGRSWAEVTLLVASTLLVLIVELLNSAVETVVDRVFRSIGTTCPSARRTWPAPRYSCLWRCAPASG